MDRAADAARSASTGCGRGGREAPADVDELDPAAVDETLAGLDEALTVRAGLDAVGDPCREILDRFFCRDESYKTIGEALDMPAGHDREPDLALPREAQGRTGGKILTASAV